MPDEAVKLHQAARDIAPDSAWPLLQAQRDRAERLLNGVRAAVLVLLTLAALAYASRLPAHVTVANIVVLAPMIAWTVSQYLLFYARPALPAWVMVANPIADITAVTMIIAAYGIAESPALALKSPILLAYFVILAARPIASSTQRAAGVAVLAVVEYAVLLIILIATAQDAFVASPIAASVGPRVSILDEGAKLLLLAVAGGIATYATQWHERLATSYFLEARNREQLEVRLAQAQLESLKLQLRPHFLFNTLNSIIALISTDPHAAERMVAGLSELLRLTVHHSGDHEVPLERELETLTPYLEIQQIRFQDRLRVEIAIDPEVRQALVPNLVLQPLVENAMQHGIGPRATGGRVEIVGRRRGEELMLEVSDDGVGARHAPGGKPRERLGLGHTRARLKHLYGPRHRFDVEAGANGGFAVRLVIPYRTAPLPQAAMTS